MGKWKRQKVAIKVLFYNEDKYKENGNEVLKKFIKEFENEAQLLARLRHKNILNFFGASLIPPSKYSKPNIYFLNSNSKF